MLLNLHFVVFYHECTFLQNERFTRKSQNRKTQERIEIYRVRKIKKNRREVTFFRYARTKGGGMGCFAMFCPVLHCRNALKVRYLLYYTRNIACRAFCRLWRAANVRNRQAQSTPTNNTTRPNNG